MNGIIERLEEIKEKVEKEAKKWERVTDCCIVCGIFLDDPTRFTCGSPQCNKELLKHGGSAALARFLEEYDVESAKELKKYINSLQNDLDEVLEEFGAEDMDDFARLKEQPPVPKEQPLVPSEEELETRGLFGDLGVDSIEEAREKIKEMKILVEEISQKLEGRKSGG